MLSNIDVTFEYYKARLNEEDTPNKKEMQKNYDKIRNGIKIKFDIYDLKTENFTDKTKSGKIIIPTGKGKHSYERKDFFTEIEERNNLMKKLLLESYKDEDIIKSRT